MNRRRILIGAGATLALGAAGGFAWRTSTGSSGDYDRLTARFRAP